MSKLKFKGKTLYTKRCVNNIMKCLTEGDSMHKYWYKEAKEYALFIKPKDVTLMQACGVIAALSPQKSWKENKKLANDFLNKNRRGGHTRAFIKKAEDILKCHTKEDILDILNGEKIKAFFLNIYIPSSVTGVTIDRHAIEIAVGKVVSNHKITINQYLFFQRCYLLVADATGLLPHEVQAVTWEYWRGLKASNNHNSEAIENIIKKL